MDKLRHFSKFVPRQEQSIYLAKNEVFKRVMNIHGAFIECGVFLGGGLMTWANFSAIYEPFNHTRRIVGFDTFTGFSELDREDAGAEQVDFKQAGGLSTGAEQDVARALSLYDMNRPIGHIPRAELVVGDAGERRLRTGSCSCAASPKKLWRSARCWAGRRVGRRIDDSVHPAKDA